MTTGIDTGQHGKLLDKIGGRPMLETIVDRLYQRIETDPRISHYFENISLERQRKLQEKFLLYLFGETDSYDGTSMREAHKRLGLTVSDLMLWTGHLLNIMNALKIPAGTVSKIGELIVDMQDDIISSDKIVLSDWED